MLPSNGHFKSIKCPFFTSGSDQCTRPYCHFRHVKKDSDDSSEEGNSSQTEASAFSKDDENTELLAAFDNLLPDKCTTSGDDEPESDAKESPEAVQSNSKPSSHRSYIPAVPPPTYKPTPIAVLKSAHLPIPYTPLVVSRTPTAKKQKSKAVSEYVPHSIGGKPYFPPYSPAIIPKNNLYEVYGPEGAQFSPNDVEPTGTGYSYASADYNPTYSDFSSVSGLSETKKSLPDPTFSPPDSPPPSPPSSHASSPPASPPASPGSPIPSPITADLDLSELDKLDLEFESDGESSGRPSSRTEPETRHSPEKRKRCGSESAGDLKKLKSFDKEKNGHSEKSSKSESKERSKSSSSSRSGNHKSSSSSSHRRSSSSSDKKKSSASDKHKETDKHKESDKHRDKHSEKDKDRLKEKSKSSNREKESDRHREKSSSSSRDKDRSRSKESEKERDRHKSSSSRDKHDRHKRRSSSSSNHSSSKKSKSKSSDVAVEVDEDLMKKVEAEIDADLEDADFIEQQCLELFSEYNETKKTSDPASTEDPRVSAQTSFEEKEIANAPVKKRIAHSNASAVPVQIVKPLQPPKHNPHLQLRERFEKAAQPRPTILVPKPYSATNPVPLTTTVGPAKKKIHSVPNVAMLLKPPTIPASTMYSSNSTATSKRIFTSENQRVDEYGRLVKARLAHTPAPAVQRKPMINPGDCRKFKASTRQAHVDKLYEAYLNAGFGESSHDMALEAERNCTQNTETVTVYSHRIIQLLKDLRAVAESSRNNIRSDSLAGMTNRVVSHNAVLAGKKGSAVSWSIEKSKKPVDVTDDPISLYDNLYMYILSKEDLEKNGFPMPSEEKGIALLKKNAFRSVEQPSDPNQRRCVRCLKLYWVDKRGEQVDQEECLHHWGRKRTVRRYREAESKYTCCDTLDEGCTVGSCHVFELNEERSVGFMSTLSKADDDYPGVYALDCEMCYTTGGLELTRVTVIKPDLSVAYETLVKPKNKILDYNTRYSGLTEEDMKNAKTTLLQVQATLLGMFSDKTILIGHSLESDMKALKLVHPTIVDTSVVFPHKMGPPYKKALKSLAADHLKKIIQDDVNGHDSKEDAVTAMELMLYKVKEDAKLR